MDAQGPSPGGRPALVCAQAHELEAGMNTTEHCPQCSGVMLDGIRMARLEVGGKGYDYGLRVRVCVPCAYRVVVDTAIPIPAALREDHGCAV